MSTPTSFKEADAMVGKGNVALSVALLELAEELGKYGFRGDIKLQLTVTIKSGHGEGDLVLGRNTEFQFKR